MGLRSHNAPVNELGNYTFYCRACGQIMKQSAFPEQCTWCGNILIDRGFGVSGDASETETLDYATRDIIGDIDKKIK